MTLVNLAKERKTNWHMRRRHARYRKLYGRRRR